MEAHSISAQEVATVFNSDLSKGLNGKNIEQNEMRFGRNVLTKKQQKGFLIKLIDALKEPMIIILIFSLILALGTNIGKYLKNGDGDFTECIGIVLAIVLSVSITLIMEGSSERAFNALNKIYDNIRVRVVRDGQVITVRQIDVVVGDVLILESGDKIVADGRLIESNSISIDESALTGESISSQKNAQMILQSSVILAERKNMVYSGTFVTAGSGKMIVTAVGDKTEMGKIAKELVDRGGETSPLQQKLNKLGKTISLIGAISAILVFIVSVFKLVYTNSLTFSSVQELFVSSIILIVAAVPEGLPTIVAMSLALNMIKLASENALIKKITATETAGAVSVICSDKTGTLTENKMKVISICENELCYKVDKKFKEPLMQNFICNTTADIVKVNGKRVYRGNGTECALIEAFIKSTKEDYTEYRNKFDVVNREPFDSDKKYMTTTIIYKGVKRKLVKGAPEIILNKCDLTDMQKNKLVKNMETHQKKARRILCFAHLDYTDNFSKENYVYDGFVSIADPIRKEVYKAVKDCKKAGIKVKILTGDNKITAYAIAKEINVAETEEQVALASDLEKLDDNSLKRALQKITVVARSTPIMKLRIVKLLKSMGEVVAVTGDGINDAPAIKQADVGIAMGMTGSEISKEAADVVLLDDSFATVVKTISFGRNVYKNLQRFILFQLSVNLSALLFIVFCALLGLEAPFNTFQLLWINVIMDGPPALTLGLEPPQSNLMNNKPIKKRDGIVSKKMLVRILINGILVSAAMILQYNYNFLNIVDSEKSSAVFTLFILFQLFNAFNSRELGAESIFKNFGKNKIMILTFIAVFAVHVLIIEVCYKLFCVSPMSIFSWVKLLGFASLIIVASECYKFIYRLFRKKSNIIKSNI